MTAAPPIRRGRPAHTSLFSPIAFAFMHVVDDVLSHATPAGYKTLDNKVSAAVEVLNNRRVKKYDMFAACMCMVTEQPVNCAGRLVKIPKLYFLFIIIQITL